MTKPIDIYRTAQLLIDQHGDKAEEHAERMMRGFMDKDDLQGGGVWLQIGAAIEDIRAVKPMGKLN